MILWGTAVVQPMGGWENWKKVLSEDKESDLKALIKTYKLRKPFFTQTQGRSGGTPKKKIGW